MHSKSVLDLITAETSHYKQLEDLADGLEKALLSRDLTAIRSFVDEEKELNKRLSRLSRERETSTAALCQGTGCHSSSLKELTLRLPEGERCLLVTARDDLIKAARAARERNHRNSLILASSLRIFNGLTDIYRQATDPGVYSGPEGAKVTQPFRQALDLMV